MENKNIYSKLLEVQKEVAPIKKTEDNPFFKSKYFDVNAILAALKPILSKHGLVLTQPIAAEEETGRNVLMTVVANTDDIADKVVSRIYLPEASDPQKFGSAVTYYRRYALQSLFALEAEDDDGNVAATHDSRPTAPVSASPRRSAPTTQPSSKASPKPWTLKAPKWEPKHGDQGRDAAENDTIINLEDQ